MYLYGRPQSPSNDAATPLRKQELDKPKRLTTNPTARVAFSLVKGFYDVAEASIRRPKGIDQVPRGSFATIFSITFCSMSGFLVSHSQTIRTIQPASRS